MRGRRSESNLYVLQVEGGSLGHMDGCKSLKKVTFEDNERFGLEGEIVESSTKSHLDVGEFDHLVAYSSTCTFENEVVSARKYEGLCFGSLDEVIKVGDFVCLDEGKGVLMEGFESGSSGRACRARSSHKTEADQ